MLAEPAPGDRDVGGAARDVDEAVPEAAEARVIDPHVGGAVHQVKRVAHAVAEDEVLDDDVPPSGDDEPVPGNGHPGPAAVERLVGTHLERSREADLTRDAEADPARSVACDRLRESPRTDGGEARHPDDGAAPPARGVRPEALHVGDQGLDVGHRHRLGRLLLAPATTRSKHDREGAGYGRGSSATEAPRYADAPLRRERDRHRRPERGRGLLPAALGPSQTPGTRSRTSSSSLTFGGLFPRPGVIR